VVDDAAETSAFVFKYRYSTMISFISSVSLADNGKVASTPFGGTKSQWISRIMTAHTDQALLYGVVYEDSDRRIVDQQGCQFGYRTLQTAPRANRRGV
jgi:hypothetical protein